MRKYHLHPEAKFLGGDWTEAGVLRRRHILAIGVTAIGKEADHLEQEHGHDEEGEAANEVGLSLVDLVRLVAEIMAARKRFGVRTLARAARVSDHTISRAVSGFNIVPDRTLIVMAEGAAALAAKAAGRDAKEARLLAWARACVKREGRNAFAASLSFDAANLGKVLAGSRKASPTLIAMLHRRPLRESDV